MSLVRRKIRTTFVLGTGNFGEQGQNQLAISGLRTSADVIYAGGLGTNTLDLAIYGMTLSHMNQLSTLGMVYTQLRRNSVTVEAGDDVKGMATVFQGTILNAWPDMNGIPNVPFRISAGGLLLESIAPSKTTSIKGGADASTILSGLATEMKLKFENNGVNVKLQNAYYTGSAKEQAQQVVQHAGIEWNNGESGTLAIWMPGKGRGGSKVLMSKDTGMVGYPTATSNGVALRTIWNPSIGLGSVLSVKSTLELNSANGEFVVYGINHHLDAYTPNGRWFSDIKAAPEGGNYTP